MKARSFGIIFLITAFTIGYYFNNSVPPKLEDGYKLNLFIGFINIFSDTVSTNHCKFKQVQHV